MDHSECIRTGPLGSLSAHTHEGETGWWKSPSKIREPAAPRPARRCPAPQPGHVHDDSCYATQEEWDRDIAAGYQGRHVASDPEGWIYE